MSITREEVENTIDKFLKENSKLNEHKISDFIRKFLKENNSDDNEYLKYEDMVFSFYLDELNTNDWGTAYGPMMKFKGKDGLWYESPSIQLVTTAHLKYWAERAKKVDHPLAKIRYSDIVWDFALKIDKTFRQYELACNVIDSTIEFISKNLYENEIEGKNKLKRALSLALSLNDKSRIRKLSKTVIQFEDCIAIDDKLGLWGFSFDILLSNKKIELEKEDGNKIINDLESRLDRTRDKSKNYSSHAVEACANRLIEYYKENNDLNALKEVLLKYGNCVIGFSKYNSGMISSHWLEKIYNLYQIYGMQDELNQISVLLRESNKKILDEMKPISHSVEIPKEHIEQFLNGILGDDFENCLNIIANTFIPDLNQIEDEVKQTAKVAPLASMFFSVNLHGEDGRTVAQIGTTEDDMDGRIVHTMSQNLQMEYFWLSHAMKGLKNKYKPKANDLLDYIYKSPIFVEDRKEILLRAFEAYLSDDYLVFSHFIIPQIENALRVLLRLNGVNIFKPNQKGGYNLYNLENILSTQLVLDIFSENIVKYFKVLLTDIRGWNLRNLFAHGIINPNSFGAHTAYRLFHVLLILSQLRLEKTA